MWKRGGVDRGYEGMDGDRWGWRMVWSEIGVMQEKNWKLTRGLDMGIGVKKGKQGGERENNAFLWRCYVVRQIGIL
jgi:hypothetical protein